MRKLLLTTAAVAAAIGLAGCAPDKFGTITDARDGKTYRTVKIGYQTWMAENLNYETQSGSWCYDNDTSYCNGYGRLYDWETAAEACPSGWHLSSDYEWDVLTDKLSVLYLSQYIGYGLKAKDGWFFDGTRCCGNGSDIYGFSALPGGGITNLAWKQERWWPWESEEPRTFQGVRLRGAWWTSTEYEYHRCHVCGRAYIRAYYRYRSSYRSSYAHFRSINGYDYDVRDDYVNKANSFSVRCVLDYIDSAELARLVEKQLENEREQKERRQKEEEQRQEDMEERIAMNTGYFTDPRDGQTYRTMAIGGKTWMAQNLNYQTGNSWCYSNKNSNCNAYGRLYDFHTAIKACPSGWHLSTREEWNHLIKTVDGTGGYGPSDRAGKKLKANCCWGSWRGYNGTDEYGFSALPGGYRYIDNDLYKAKRLIGYIYEREWYGDWYGYRRERYTIDDDNDLEGADRQSSWWTATEGARGSAYRRYIRYDKDYVGEDNYVKEYGFSVRCVADNP
jgi:uncharacterized protein (TIGR02145 family)